MTTILVLEPRDDVRAMTTSLISSRSSWMALPARTAAEVRSLTAAGRVDLIVADLGAMGDGCAEMIQETAPVPVIVTAEREGSERLIDALEAGAVNYIPGHLRQARLLQAVKRALLSALATSKRAKLLGWMQDCHSRFSIPTDVSMLPAAADRLQASLELFGLCDEIQTTYVRIAIDEALANAFYHGNLGVSSELKDTHHGDFERLVQERLREQPYRDRRIEIEEHLNRDEARFVIRDEGDGFDVLDVHNPTNPNRLLLNSGRGILIMRHFLDEVIYSNRGREVTLIKRCDARAAAPSHPDRAMDVRECASCA
ncbi:MAG: ATP-binding protein [Planctomycetaceae bacterium]|nr:ATP-binding protein [Planctomycetaceae bacterium]